MGVGPIYTTPNTALCRAFFKDPATGLGWSETMWFPGVTAANYGEAQKRARIWLLVRSQLLGVGPRIDRAMVSVDGPFRDEAPVELPSEVKAPATATYPSTYTIYWGGATALQPADAPWTTIKVSGYTSNGLYQDRRQLAGVSDQLTDNDGMVSHPFFANAWNVYQLTLTGFITDKFGNKTKPNPLYPAGLYGFPVTPKPPDIPAWTLVTGAGVGLPPASLVAKFFVVAPGLVANVGDIVRVGQVKGVGTAPNGTHIVVAISGNTYYLDTPDGTAAGAFLWTRGGYVHPVTRVVKAYGQLRIDGQTRRKRGTGFARPRGRGRVKHPSQT